MQTTRRQLAFGLAVWGVSICFAWRDLATAILLFAPLVVVPLGLGLINVSGPESDSRRDRLIRWSSLMANWLRLPAACCLAVGLALPAGVGSALWACPWLALTGFLALIGVGRLIQRGGGPAWQVSQDVALVLIAIGGAWTFMHCLGWWPLDFEPVIVQLTAVHFHYAAFALPVILAEVARRRPGRLFAAIVAWVVVSIPLLAVGITYSPELELAASALLVVACCSLAGVQLRLAFAQRLPLAVSLLAISSMCLLAGMGLAGTYALGEYLGREWIDIPTMIPLHGVANAFGFSLCGMLGWKTSSLSQLIQGEGETLFSRRSGEI